MRSSPQIARFSDGERFPYQEDEDGLMSVWPTLYTAVRLRPQKTANAIRNDLAALAHLAVWERLANRNLVVELGEQRFPTAEDIESLREHCQRDSLDLRRYLDRAKPSPKNSIDLIAPIQKVAFKTVAKSHAYNRLTVFANYLYFCAVTLFRTRPNAGALSQRAKEMHQALLAQRPKGKSRRTGLAVHPSPEYFDDFMGVVAECAPDNPFKSVKVRLRNFVIFQMIFETGMRSGELLGLYVGDLIYDDKGDPVVRVIDRRDDPNDPRANPPAVKTLERDIPISQRLYEKVQEYITSVRYCTKNARMHPFLFVNHRNDAYLGHPMSDKNFQNELRRVVAVRPDRFKDIRRHGFRHNFNVRLTDQLDLYSIQEKPLTDQQRLDIRKNLNGHDGNESGLVYEQAAIRAKANKAMRQHQDKQSAVLKKALKQAKTASSADDDQR